jgi:hypothetical protein
MADTDDLPGDSSTPAVLKIGEKYAAQWHRSFDHDFFRIELQAGVSYLFRLLGAREGEGTASAEYMYLCLNLLDSNSSFLWRKNSRGDEPTVFEYTPTTSGTYYINALSQEFNFFGPGAGTYAILVEERTAADDYTASTNTTAVLEIGSYFDAKSEVAGDTDFFKFTVEAGKFYQAGLSGAEGLILGGNIVLLDNSGRIVETAWPFQAQSNGTYYLAHTSNKVGSYGIRIREMEDDFSDSAATTTGRLNMNSSVEIRTNYAYDRDVVLVNLAADVSYKFTLADGSQYGNISLRDANGIWVSGLSYGSNDIIITATVSGNYSISVESGYGSIPTLPYLIKVEQLAAIPDQHGDTIATAHALSLATTVNGDLSTDKDVDVFKVDLVAGVTYDFSMTSLSTQVKWTRADGSVAAQLDTSGQLHYTADVSGSYYYSISGPRAATYSLHIAPLADDTAANLAGAVSLAVQGVANGTLPLDDQDWIAMDLSAGQAYSLQAAQSSLDGMVLTLRNPAGTVVVMTEETINSVKHMEFTAQTAGRYILALERTGSYFYSNAYEIRLDIPPTDEAGASAGSAVRISDGQLFAGEISKPSDIDVVKFTVVAGEDYRFLLNRPKDYFQPVYSLKDAAGNAIDVAWSGGHLFKTEAIYRATFTGDVYLHMGQTGYNPTGPYTIQASKIARDEYGADANTAGVIVPGQTVSAAIQHDYDVDVVKVHLVAGQLYNFEIKGAFSGDGTLPVSEIEFNMRTASGSWVASPRYATVPFLETRVNETGDYYLHIDPRFPQTGTYQLVASAPDDHGYTPAFSTELSVGATVSGKLGANFDIDAFAIKVESGKDYKLAVNGANLDASVFVSVFDWFGNFITDSPITTASEKIASLSAKFNDTYYARVWSNHGRQFDYSVSFVEVQGAPDVGSTEATASLLPSGVSQTSRIDVAGDKDVWKISVPANSAYLLSLAASGDMSYTVAGLGLTSHFPPNVQGVTKQYVHSDRAQDLYIWVNSSANMPTGQYTLSFTAQPQDDFTGDATTTALLATGVPLQASLSYQHDVDWFGVDLVAGQSYRFDLLGSTSGKGTLDTNSLVGNFGIRDANGQSYASSGFAGAEPAFGFTAPSTGKYFVAIHGSSGPTGSYTVKVAPDIKDTTGPLLVSQFPAAGTANWTQEGAVSFTFDENVMSNTEFITFVDSRGTWVPYTAFYGMSSGRGVLIDPASQLKVGETYTVSLLPGAVSDSLGNKNASAIIFSFKPMASTTVPTAGNDLFNASGDGARISGGTGTDTVVFSDRSSIFTVSRSGGDVIVTHAQAATGDRLTDVERIYFTDKAVAFDSNGAGGQAYRLYQAAFNRTPDKAGVGYWISQLDKGTSLASVANAFVGSAEFKSLYGAAPSNLEFVNLLYSNVLDRPGEKAGVDFWVNALSNGVSRMDLLMQFSESGENQAGVATLIANGFEYVVYG